jgi:glycosyltransferase involved in cell wall biosynthesis
VKRHCFSEVLVARILMIAYTGYASDARVKRHAQALADRGDEIDVICLRNEQAGPCDGVNVIGIDMPRYRGTRWVSYFLSYLRFFVLAAWTGFRRSLERPYEVAITCSMPDAVVLCTLPLRLFGTKVLLDIHDTMPELYLDKRDGKNGERGARLLRCEERVSAWFADHVLAVHELHRRRLEQAGIAANKISVVLNAPDQKIFGQKQPAGSNHENFTLVCHGTITKRLGIDVALKALALLRERLPDARMIVVGSGDYLPKARTLTSELGVEKLVEFVPPVPVEALPAIIQRGSVGLVPNHASPATHLMLPVKLLEYAALGLPVIASRLRTIEHYFSDGAVRFFEPDDPAALAAAIADIHDNPSIRWRMVKETQRTMDLIDWREERMHYFRAVDALLAPSGRTEMPATQRRYKEGELR